MRIRLRAQGGEEVVTLRNNPWGDFGDVLRSNGTDVRWGGWRVVTLCLALEVSLVASDAPGYRVEGVLSTTVVREGQGTLSSNQVPFLVEVVGGAWRLVIGIDSHSQSKATREIVSDGMDTVEVLRGSGVGGKVLPAVMHRDGFPGLGYYPDIVWLAYASAPYLSQGRPLPAPWLSVRHDARAWSYEARVTTNQELPGLPARIEFLTKPKRTFALLSASPPGDSEPVRAGEYRVSATTNLGGLAIPTQFELSLFPIPGPPQKGKPTVIATNLATTMVIGVATQITACAKAPAWPALEGVASVSDRRFRSSRHRIEAIRYNVTNHWLIDTNDVALGSLFERKKKEVPWMVSHRGWGIGGICFLAVAPFLGWWFIFQKSKRT
jgi:hypothetical protein